jgi:3-(3-hydroxy-phenyl)propionate hydroxylase
MSGVQKVDVLIAGAGPVGLALANLLGSAGLSVLLVERNPDTVPEPRAIALDGESLRTLQATGLADTVLPTIREGFRADYVNGKGERLFFSDLRPRPYGFCLQNSFDQPTLERQLLAGLARFEKVDLCFSTELLAFNQSEAEVQVEIRDPDKRSRNIAARYLIGCDGGRSTVRQQLGIEMQGDRLPQRWLVIDTVDTHLTGDPECRFYCDPARPAMTMLRPGNERRWEWMLLEGEEDEAMLQDRAISELLAPHTDVKCVDVYRKVVYGFSAVVAERFAAGRVFLAGDAAHMTPPFAGQGLNAGVRDVRNLSWKLVAVLRDGFPPALLDSYDRERHDAARDMVNMAVALGEQIQPTDPAAAAERDAFFAELNRDPAAAEQFSLDLLAPLHDVRIPAGWFADDGFGGRLLPQPEVSGAARRLDDTLPQGFVALVPPGATVPTAITEHPLWRRLAPPQCPLPRELADFVGSFGGALLLRPDRFVLAALPLDESSRRVLNALEAQLTGR